MPGDATGRPRGSRFSTLRTLLKIPVVYLVFGVAYAALVSAYCFYRAAHDVPSDLPCVSEVWTSLEILGWPLMALGNALNGQAVLVPSIVVRSFGAAFLVGFVVVLVAWVQRGDKP
jgi:hypothetical protein